MSTTLEIAVKRTFVYDGTFVNVLYVPLNPELEFVLDHGADLDFSESTLEEVITNYMPTARSCLLEVLETMYPGVYV